MIHAAFAGLIWLQALFGLPSAGLAVATFGPASEATLFMASSDGKLWLHCEIDATGANHNQLAGFCDLLAAEITRLAGQKVQLGGNAPIGATVLGVRVVVINANRANVVLTTARQGPAGPEMIEKQELRIGQIDARLRPSSVSALVFPLMKMLDDAT